jgi:hypothetical protein
VEEVAGGVDAANPEVKGDYEDEKKKDAKGREESFLDETVLAAREHSMAPINGVRQNSCTTVSPFFVVRGVSFGILGR